MNRQGGPRQPNKPQPASGPGRYSTRQDAQQVRTPNVGDDPSLNQGDRAQLEAAQRVQPLPKTRTQPPPLRDIRGGISDRVFERPTQRPSEPITHGAEVGLGGGPEVLNSHQPTDPRNVVLGFLAANGNEKAQQLLTQRAPQEIPTLPVPQETDAFAELEPVEEPDEQEASLPVRRPEQEAAQTPQGEAEQEAPEEVEEEIEEEAE